MHNIATKWLRFIAWIKGPEKVFGLSLGIGIVALGTVGSIFAVVLEDVLDGHGIAIIDQPLLHFLASHRTPLLTDTMRVFTDLVSPFNTALLAVLIAGWLAWRWRQWWPLGLAVATVGGMELIITIIKQTVARNRPPLMEAVDTAHGFAFPSGHTAMAVAAFGISAWLLTHSVASLPQRVAVWTIASIAAILVGFSRLYLGVHWFTDVAGSWTLAICWLLILLVPLTILFRWRAGKLKAVKNV